MTNQETEAAADTDQMKQIIKSNGFGYNIVFYVDKLSTSLIRSPIYFCGNNKIQILINLESKKLSISINYNEKLNDLGDLVFDYFVPNIDTEKSLHFNEKTKLPFETQLNFDDITDKNGWIINGSLQNTIVIKESQKDEFTESQKLDHMTFQKYLSPVISSAKEKIEWLVSNLSESHSSTKYDIKFADVVFILSLKNDAYSFSMSFESIYGGKAFIKAKLTIYNKDSTKNIVKNIYEYATSSTYKTYPVLLSELKAKEITAENGWINDNCLKITVEFTNDHKKAPNLLTKRIQSNESNHPVTNFCRLPAVDYIQSIPLNGSYYVELMPTIDDVSGKIYTKKIRIGKLFATFSVDVEKTMSSFVFENLEKDTKFYSVIRVQFLNQKAYNEYDTIFQQYLSKDNSSISFDTPFNSNTIKEEGWLFKPDTKNEEEETKHPSNLIIQIKFDINSQPENSSPFDPIEIKENFHNGPNKKYNLTIEIPQAAFESPLIILPSIIFNSKKMKTFMTTKNNAILFDAYLEGFSNVILEGTMTIVNHKNPSENAICHFDSFKKPSFLTYMEINLSVLLANENDYIDPSNHYVTLKISFSTNEDSYVYLASEPTFEKYVSYVNEDENELKNKEFRKEQEVGNYVGLINQGATCYMNSMLQALFHLPAFRRIVYNMPTNPNENPEKSIPLNLQRLFCEMQFSKTREACSTENLTKSFGWGSQETFVQHDVEEFCRVLMDNLQNKLKGEPSLENSIKDLFEVKARHAIRCVNVDYESINKEELLDIQLNVKGCRNLEESFKKYIAKELLDGDNKYSTDKYGKQDAEMSEEFVEFPPVLHLHLKRFIFDYNTMKMTKLNDYFEFPEQIDLTKYLANDSPSLSKSNLYDLYGVLVHSGGILGGHYNAYLRTSTKKQWYFFNDSHVTPVSTYKAVRANYGYTESDEKASIATFDFLGTKDEIEERNTTVLTPSEQSQGKEDESKSNDSKYDSLRLYESTKNGYLLIYVRHDDAPYLFAPIPEETVPHHLIEYVNEHANRRVQRSHSDFDKSFTLSFTFEDDLKQMTVDYLTNFSLKRNRNIAIIKSNDPISYAQVYQLAANEFKIPVEQIRIWCCSTSSNPNKTLPFSEKDLVKPSYYENKFLYFVQRKKPEEKIEINTSQKLVFLKFFFPGKEDPVQFLKSAIIDKADIESTINMCKKIVIDTLGLPPDMKLNAYSETINGLPKKIGKNGQNNHFTFIENGHILIFEPPSDSVINPPNFVFAKKSKIENESTEEKSTDEKTTDEKSTEEKSTEEKSTDEKTTEEKSTEEKSTEEKSTDEKTTKEKSTDEKIAEEKITNEKSVDGDNDNITVYHLSEYFNDLSLNLLHGFWLSLNNVEFEVYDIWNQTTPLFKIVAPEQIYTDLVMEKIAEFANIDYNEKEDSLLLLILTNYFNDKIIQYVDQKYQKTLQNLFKVSPAELNVKTNRLYFMHCRKFNYENKVRLNNNFPNIFFSFDAISIELRYCLPILSDMNLYKIIKDSKRINEGIIGDGTFRLLKINNSKIIDYYTDAREDSKEVIKFDQMSKFRFELVPQSQTDSQLKQKNAELLKVCYAQKKQYFYSSAEYQYEAYGQPFLFEIIKDEIFSQTLLRLKKYMGLADTDNLESYQFLLSIDGSLYTYNSAKNFVELLDGMKLYDKYTKKSQLLIISSQSKSKKHQKMKRQTSNDIKIYN